MTAAIEPDPISAPPTLRGRVIGLFQRNATWVLIDQGIVSVGNFLTAKGLGSYLPRGDFGNFGLLIETMLFLNSLQAALVIYPMTIKGATGDRENLGRMASASAILTLLLLPLLGAGMAGSVAQALHGWSIAVPAVAAMLLWQLQEMTRRALMADMRFADTIWGDFISYPGQAIGVTVLGKLGMLTLYNAFVVMAATSAIAIFIQAIQIGLRTIQTQQIKTVALEFWRLGRWVMLSNGGTIVTSLGYWWTLQAYYGPDDCGVFNAIVQLFKPANPIMNSMNGLIVPAVARVSASEGVKAATRKAWRYILFGALLLTPYFLLLIVFPDFVLKHFYRPEQHYDQYGNWLRLFVLNYSAVFVAAMLGAWLGGLGKSHHNFHARLTDMIATLLIGLPCTAKWGVPGLIIGGLVASVINAVTSAYFIHQVAYKQGHAPSAS
ncbi:MAG TPA: hypothetical protein VHD56_18795 [Tepidisphaeraceae bacterium]|nr:hypothetical protein [Tepidisphaeraceae bacterium]